MRRLAGWAGPPLLWWLVLTGLYMIITGPPAPLEWLVGAGAALLATIGAVAIGRASEPRRGGSARLGAALAGWPVTLARDTGRLAAITWRALRGRATPGHVEMLRLVPGAGAPWAAALLSSTPGACVLDAEVATDRRRGQGDLLTIHLLPGPVSAVERAVTEGREP